MPGDASGNEPPSDPSGSGGSGSGPATLHEALARIAALEQQIRELQQAAPSPDPVVVVDRAGVVARVSAWRWSEPPRVGAPLSDAFDVPSRSVLAEMLARGWAGASEQRLALASGRPVSLSVAREEHHFRIAVHDLTYRQLVEVAVEQRRRMRALSELAGSLARELTDPMSIVQGRLELLLDLGVSEASAVRRHLEVALQHARRISATVSNLRLVGRPADPTRESVPVREAVQEALELLGPRQGQVVHHVRPADLAIGCEQSVTARVLASLVRQALEAQGRGVIHLRASRDGNHVSVRIGPNRGGAGVAVDGDELSLERTLLASVGGVLTARRNGMVLQFDVVLPCAPTQRAKRRPPCGRVLLVGRQALLERIPSLLARDGFRFDTARTVPEAIELLQHQDVDAVVAELLLGGGNSGLFVARWLLERPVAAHPRLVLVYEGTLPDLPAPLVLLRWPPSRAELLEALGGDR